MALYTVFGGRGFIGSEIVIQLQAKGHTTFIPARDDTSLFERELGIVLYCAGNGDCKNTPFSVLEANVSLLAQILQHANFERLLYVSSTRVYMNQASANEHANLTVCVDDNRRLFNLTKLVAEELCLKSGRNVCIVRPSNVYGVALNSKLFLPSIIKDSIETGVVNMYVPDSYSKDYVFIKDVVSAIYKISKKEVIKHKVINIASGINTKAKDIASVLMGKTNCTIVWHGSETKELFAPIDISIIKKEIEFQPRNVLDDLEDMISKYIDNKSSN
jgi:nucleoside-diphosphate-sugar epimerase